MLTILGLLIITDVQGIKVSSSAPNDTISIERAACGKSLTTAAFRTIYDDRISLISESEYWDKHDLMAQRVFYTLAASDGYYDVLGYRGFNNITCSGPTHDDGHDELFILDNCFRSEQAQKVTRWIVTEEMAVLKRSPSNTDKIYRAKQALAGQLIFEIDNGQMEFDSNEGQTLIYRYGERKAPECWMQCIMNINEADVRKAGIKLLTGETYYNTRPTYT